MKTASPTLISLLSTNTSFKTCDLYEITLTNGTILYYTSGDRNTIYDSNTYINGLAIKRDSLSFKKGISVDDLTLSIYPKDTDLIGTVSILKAFRNGTFDGAILRLHKAFFTNWNATPEVLEDLFLGKIETDEIGESEIKLSVNSMTIILNTPFPKQVYQASCPWLLYDSNTCKVNKSLHTYTSSVLSNSTKKIIKCGLTQANNYFDQGVILFTSGNNLNIKKTVKLYTTGQIELGSYLQYAPSFGDTFTISRGCSHAIDDCINKYDNFINNGSEPFVPESTTAY